MAFPTWGAAGTVAEGGVGIPATIQPAWPAHAAGDIGILILVSGHIFVDVSNPQGFVEMHCSPQKGGNDNQTSTAILRVFWKRAESSAEVGPTIVVPSSQVIAQIVTIKGCAASGSPFDTQAGSVNFAGGTSMTWPSIVTTNPECLVMGIMGHSIDNGNPQGSGYTNTSIGNLTERVDHSSIIGDGAGIIIWTGTRTNPGTVASTQATLANTSRQGLVTIAFTAVAQPVDQTPTVYKFGAPQERDTAGTISPAWPTDHAAGDVGILVVASGGWPLTFANQQGFTQFNASPQNAGVSGDINSASLHMFWKRATSGAEPAPVINFISDHLRAFIFTVKGCAGSGFPVWRSEGNVSAAPGTDAAWPIFSTQDPYMLMVAAISHSRESGGAETIEFASPNIPFFNEKYDVGSNIGSGAGIAIGTGARQTPGQCDVTATLAASHHSARILIALRPSSGATVVAERGRFNLSGKAGFLLKGVRIISDKGGFVLSGKAATFEMSTRYTFTCDKGVFVVSGGDAGVVKSLANWTKDGMATNVWTKDTAI